MKISVAGTGYVGMSIATLLAQHNEVTAVDVVPERVDMVNNKKSPIQDDYIEEYLATNGCCSPNCFVTTVKALFIFSRALL